jgi:SPP1 family predicted phage head-tail adaptor
VRQLKDIGNLKQRIGFATRTTTISDSGGQIESFSVPTANIPAMVRYVSTNEAEGFIKQEKFVTDIKVWVRYSTSYTTYKYVYWGAKYYDITGIESTPDFRFHVIKARLIEA